MERIISYIADIVAKVEAIHELHILQYGNRFRLL